MAKKPVEPQIDGELQPRSDNLPEPHLLLEPEAQFQNFLSKPRSQVQTDVQSETQLGSHPDNQSQPQPNPRPESQNQAWIWRRRHRLIVLLVSTFCVSILGLAYFFHQHLPAGTPSASPTCTTSACEKAAARLAVTVDPFSKPCDYFLDTCGYKDGESFKGRNRGKNIPVHPQGRNSRAALLKKESGGELGTQTEIRDATPVDRMPNRVDALLLAMRDVLESEDSSTGDSAKQKPCRFYRSCMNTGPTETAGQEPFLLLVHQLGGWAVSGQWNRTDFNTTLSLLMRDYATFPFFSVYAGKDPNDPQGNKMVIQTLRPFMALCQRLMALLGFPSKRTNVHVGLFISLSSELAAEASPLAYRLEQGMLHHRLTIRELQTLAPAIDWLGCLQATFHPHPVSQSDHVLLHNLPYISHMSRIIRKWLGMDEMSSNGPVHTFMVFDLLHTVIPALDSRFAQAERNFSIALGTEHEEVPRWRQCVLKTEKGFHMILAQLLISSQSESPRSIAECVWSQYLNVTGGTGSVGSLSWTQHQEMWVQHSALQVALQAYNNSLKKFPRDLALSGLSYTHLFLTSFTQINCDTDLYRGFMPVEPSFLVTVICGNSDLCPTTLTCPDKLQQPFLQMC
ncbi:hypothetical protein DPEC_G00143840 [Dallia pectoralis]|uniref:Uncharacterized protein n=1 Tax=Dallia pectoralis TaxID=75939 RepID=A0ACC2GP01_DALPE|nr:hypothetical protein DPEC_G00143840 [Dallia pectoralis]